MKKHPNKEIREALKAAAEKGWTVVEVGKSAHAFCRIQCGNPEHKGCQMSVWSTPKSPENHAKQIWKMLQNCHD